MTATLPPAERAASGSAPLTKHQRQSLAMLARRGWSKFGSGRPFDQWRHHESIRVCGRRISEAAQRDFLTLRAHFLDLAGQSAAALRTHLEADSEPHRVALWHLRRECSRRRLPLDYAAAICRRQFRCHLPEANPKQIWCLIFTVRNRRKPAA
jgi:hypothetical protein